MAASGHSSEEILAAPEVGPETATEICRQLFFAPVSVRPLPGYADANFRVEAAGGERYLMKVSDARANREAIDLERLALEHLETEGWTEIPRLRASREGRMLERLQSGEEEVDVRLLSWVEGVPMAELERFPEHLVAALGERLARLDLVLRDVRPTFDRLCEWDLARLERVLPRTDVIADAEDRRLARSAMESFLEIREERLADLPRSLIHNDANEHNVLVSSADPTTARLCGLIDFGDLAVTEAVYEVAIAAVYMGLGRDNPWLAAHPLIDAYDHLRPLNDAEWELLCPAMRARLALSVTMAAQRRCNGTADAYALVSEKHARAALRFFSNLSTDVARADSPGAEGGRGE